MPILGYKVAESYKWPSERVKNMNYLDFYLLSDALVAEKFEGSPSRGNFSDQDWFLIRNAQKVVLLKSFDRFANRMFATRNFH